MLYALLPGGTASLEAFNSNTLQKFLIRQLRIIDAIARGAPTKVTQSGTIVLDTDAADHGHNKDLDDDGAEDEDAAEPGPRAGTGAGQQLSDKSFLPTKCNPVHNLAYGQLLTVSRSYGSAISECRIDEPQQPRHDSDILPS